MKVNVPASSHASVELVLEFRGQQIRSTFSPEPKPFFTEIPLPDGIEETEVTISVIEYDNGKNIVSGPYILKEGIPFQVVEPVPETPPTPEEAPEEAPEEERQRGVVVVDHKKEVLFEIKSEKPNAKYNAGRSGPANSGRTEG